MKNLKKLLMSIAVVAISFTSCENNFEELQIDHEGFELTVVANNLSRTEYDADLKDIKWSTGDKANVIVNGEVQALTASIDRDDQRIASFTYGSATLTAGTHLVQGFAPSTALDVQYEGDAAVRYSISLPANQAATTTTFDKSADILVADNLYVSITDRDIAAGGKSVGNFNFHRMVAISKFTYNVTDTTLATSDAKVESASFEVVSASGNKFLAGDMHIQPNENGAKYVDAAGAELADTNDCFYGADASKVTVTLTDKPALKDGFTVWFVTAPITLAADDKIIFTINTDDGSTITKTINSVGKELSFTTSRMNTLGVTLDNSIKIEKSIKILAIGNSFSVDAMEYLYGILSDVGYTDITLGNLYIGGCSLETHASHFTSNNASYTYYKNTDNKWTSTASYAPHTALTEQEWDFISMQQASGVSGVASSYDPFLDNLISVVKQKSPNSELVWHMTWAYQGDSTHSSFPTYGSNQMTMYNAIVSAVQSRIVGDGNFVKIIPTGTAVQNMRTSFVGDTLTRDGYHMSYDNGRYLAALTFAKGITGCDLSKVNYTPSQYSYTDTIRAAMKEAVENAMTKPFEVTASTYLTDPDAEKKQSFEYLLSQSGYDIANFEAIELGVMPYSYYNSTGGSGTNSSKIYNSSNVSTNTPTKYAATKIFAKSEIPNGSLIVVKSGYQYRPEGWVALDQKPSARPDNTSATIVVVSDAWWGDYNYRAFNLAKSGNPTLSEEEMAAVCECFAIFTPKSDDATSSPMANLLTQNGYNPSNFTELPINWTKFAYYYSTKDDKGYSPSQLKDTAYSSSTAAKFVATQIFTKSEIPNGSVIVVINGYKYRPEGWTSLDTKNSTSARPGEVSTTLVEVNDSWWGSWNYRGFNVGNGSALTNATADEACASFAIFVPKK